MGEWCRECETYASKWPGASCDDCASRWLRPTLLASPRPPVADVLPPEFGGPVEPQEAGPGLPNLKWGVEWLDEVEQ